MKKLGQKLWIVPSVSAVLLASLSSIAQAVDAPEQPVAVAMSESVAVAVPLSIDAPAQTIVVTASDAQTCTYESTADDRFCVISGLSNGVDYSFTATTTVDGVTSTASASVSATPMMVSAFVSDDEFETQDVYEGYGFTLVDSTNTYRYAIGGSRGKTAKIRNSDGEVVATGSATVSQYSGPRSGTMLTDDMLVLGTDQNADVNTVDASSLAVLDTLENLQYGIKNVIKDPLSADHVYVLGDYARSYGTPNPVIRYVSVAIDGTMVIEATTQITGLGKTMSAATLVDPSATAGDEYFVVALKGVDVDNDSSTPEPDEFVKVPLSSLVADSTAGNEDTGDLVGTGLTRIEATTANTGVNPLRVTSLMHDGGVLYFGGNGISDPWPSYLGRLSADLTSFSSVIEGPATLGGFWGDVLVAFNTGYRLMDYELFLFDTTATPIRLVGGAASSGLGDVDGVVPVGSDGLAYSVGGAERGDTSNTYFARVIDLNSDQSVGRSGAPELVSSSGSSGGINLYWREPTNDGGFPITGYLVEAKEGDGAFEAASSCSSSLTNSSSTSCSISDVTAGEDYVVRISALTAAGIGTPVSTDVLSIPESTGGGGGGGSYTPPTIVQPESVTAVLGADGVTVTISGVPSGIDYMGVRVSPTSWEPPNGPSDEPYYAWFNAAPAGADWLDEADGVAEVIDGVITLVIPNLTLEDDSACDFNDLDSWPDCVVSTSEEFSAGTAYRVTYSSEGEDGDGRWRMSSFDDETMTQNYVAVTAGGASDDTASDESLSGVVAPGEGAVSSQVTESNASTFVRNPGEVSLVDSDGNPVIGELVRVSDAVGSVPAGSRTAEQVAQIRSEAQAMVAALEERLPDGVSSPVSVVETESGANISGLVTDPADDTSDLPVPAEDVVLLVTEEQALLIGGADGPADPADVRNGVLEIGPDGEVSALAYGLTPGASGELVVMSSPTLLGTFTVGADGSFQGQAALPSTLAAGSHTVVLAADGLVASAGVVVTGGVTLPVTGGESSSVPWAVLVVAAGALAVLVIRRRVVV